jgi:hypothetical protein
VFSSIVVPLDGYGQYDDDLAVAIVESLRTRQVAVIVMASRSGLVRPRRPDLATRCGEKPLEGGEATMARHRPCGRVPTELPRPGRRGAVDRATECPVQRR